MAPLQAYDLHEIHRPLQTLTDYEHISRLVRLCTVHFFRNIDETGLGPEIRQKMKSLACVQHKDWDGTIKYIEEHGGKPGKGKNMSLFIGLNSK